VLKQLRRFHGSIANRILYSVLALAFIGWGVGTFGSESVDIVAQVHDARITRRDLDRESALLQRRYEQLLKGVTLPRMPDLRSQALENLIDAALVEHEVRQLGLEVTDEQVASAVRQMPELQENGRAFFQLLRKYTVIGFYTSRMGMEQLGAPGLKFYTESPECPHGDDPEHKHLPVPLI
jgi:parvulin-like peptidyl-prolyl isomerase